MTKPSWEKEFDLVFGYAIGTFLKGNFVKDLKGFIRSVISQELKREREKIWEKVCNEILPKVFNQLNQAIDNYLKEREGNEKKQMV